MIYLYILLIIWFSFNIFCVGGILYRKIKNKEKFTWITILKLLTILLVGFPTYLKVVFWSILNDIWMDSVLDFVNWVDITARDFWDWLSDHNKGVK